ncbi:MAG: hypothetical protein HZB51_10260 [Chloroflexi bacterium]|nr:hypothetical protein [Chloroflexota bacterium]
MSVIIVVIQAAVWITLGYGFYLLWMNGQKNSPLTPAARAHNLSRTLGALHDLWLIIGFGLVVLMLLAVLIPALESNASIPTSCVTSPSEDSAVQAIDDSTAMICAQTPPTSPPDEQHSNSDYLLLEISSA